jgi:hypothetical protein
METESETYGYDINTPLSTPLFMSPSIVPNKYFYFFSFQSRAGARLNFRGTVHDLGMAVFLRDLEQCKWDELNNTILYICCEYR